jgi:hypothetical protein
VKTFLLLSFIGFFVVTIVAAVVFRSTRAKNTLVFVRNVGWAYVAVVIGLALIHVYNEGF